MNATNGPTVKPLLPGSMAWCRKLASEVVWGSHSHMVNEIQTAIALAFSDGYQEGIKDAKKRRRK